MATTDRRKYLRDRADNEIQGAITTLQNVRSEITFFQEMEGGAPTMIQAVISRLIEATNCLARAQEIGFVQAHNKELR